MATIDPEDPLAVAAVQAVRSGDVALLDALIAAGADVEAAGSVIDGGGALSDAVAFSQWRAAAELLLARGAELNWVGHDGLTPLDAARRSDAQKPADWLPMCGARSAPEATGGAP